MRRVSYVFHGCAIHPTRWANLQGLEVLLKNCISDGRCPIQRSDVDKHYTLYTTKNSAIVLRTRPCKKLSENTSKTESKC
eukprot:1526777-Amphidinium_carterae.1